MLPSQRHASPRRGAEAHSDGTTGEIRVPLSLYRIDEVEEDVDLVLSRSEGEQLLERLRAALTASVETTYRRPEVVQ